MSKKKVYRNGLSSKKVRFRFFKLQTVEPTSSTY